MSAIYLFLKYLLITYVFLMKIEAIEILNIIIIMAERLRCRTLKIFLDKNKKKFLNYVINNIIIINMLISLKKKFNLIYYDLILQIYINFQSDRNSTFLQDSSLIFLDSNSPDLYIILVT